MLINNAGFGVLGAVEEIGISEGLAMEVKPLGIKVTIFEPGYFRTDFLDGQSLTICPTVIEDYAETTGAVVRLQCR